METWEKDKLVHQTESEEEVDEEEGWVYASIGQETLKLNQKKKEEEKEEEKAEKDDPSCAAEFPPVLFPAHE